MSHVRIEFFTNEISKYPWERSFWCFGEQIYKSTFFAVKSYFNILILSFYFLLLLFTFYITYCRSAQIVYILLGSNWSYIVHDFFMILWQLYNNPIMYWYIGMFMMLYWWRSFLLWHLWYLHVYCMYIIDV